MIILIIIRLIKHLILITLIITRLIVIDITPLTMVFCSCPLFCNYPLADLQLSAVKRYYFQYKVFVGLVLLTSNYMFHSGNFRDKSTSWFLKILKLPSFYSGNFKFFKNALGQLIPNCPSKHVITSTNFNACIYSSLQYTFLTHFYK